MLQPLSPLQSRSLNLGGDQSCPCCRMELLVMCCPRPCSGFQAGGRNDHLPLSCQNFSDLQASKNLWNNLRKGRSSLNIVFPSSKCLPKCGCFQDSTHWWDEFSLAEWRTSRHPHATGTPSSWATKSAESQHPWQFMWCDNVWYWFPCKPTYPIQKDRWEDEFPFPLVAYIVVLWLVPTASKRLCFQDVATSTCQSPSLPVGNPFMSQSPVVLDLVKSHPSSPWQSFRVASFDCIKMTEFSHCFLMRSDPKTTRSMQIHDFGDGKNELEAYDNYDCWWSTPWQTPSLPFASWSLHPGQWCHPFFPGHQQHNMCQVAASMTSLFRVFPGFNALQNKHALAWSAQVEGKKNPPCRFSNLRRPRVVTNVDK